MTGRGGKPASLGDGANAAACCATEARVGGVEVSNELGQQGGHVLLRRLAPATRRQDRFTEAEPLTELRAAATEPGAKGVVVGWLGWRMGPLRQQKAGWAAGLLRLAERAVF